MQVIPVTAVHRGFGTTSRRDNWWAAPLGVFFGLSVCLTYMTWAAFQGRVLRIRSVSLAFVRPGVVG